MRPLRTGTTMPATAADVFHPAYKFENDGKPDLYKFHIDRLLSECACRRPNQIAICVPSSTTRLGGSLKNFAGDSAFATKRIYSRVRQRLKIERSAGTSV